VAKRCTVGQAGCDAAYGNYVVLSHGNGYFTRYGHLASPPLPQDGTTVAARAAIGVMGTTGRSKGVHLHFGVYKDNGNGTWDGAETDKPVDPFGWRGQDADPWVDVKQGPASYRLWLYDPFPSTTFLGSQAVMLVDPSGTVKIVVPANTFAGEVTLEQGSGLVAAPSAQLRSARHPFWLWLRQLIPLGGATSSAVAAMALPQPVLVEVTYTDDDVRHLDATNLAIHRWDEGAQTWQVLPTTIDASSSRATAQTAELGDFALFAPLACPTDSAEPNDTYSAATALPVNGTEVSGLFDIADDEDRYRLDLAAGQKYLLRTSGLAAGVDTSMQVYGLDGLTLLASDDNSGGGLASQLVWQAPQDGTYFIRVSRAGSSAYGCSASYALSATPAQSLAVTVSGAGTVASVPTGIACPGDCGEDYAKGSSVALTATPSAGYTFAGWTVDGAVVGSTNPYAVTMSASHTVTATFRQNPPPVTTYTLALSSTTGGSASASPPGPSYAAGTSATLTATPSAGYRFTGWTVDGVSAGDANPYTLTMTKDRSAVATFAPDGGGGGGGGTPRHTLTVSAGAGGSSTGGGTYAAGSQATLTAAPDAGFVFAGWTVDGVFAGWASPLTLTMDSNRTAAATFAASPNFPDVPPSHPAYEAISQLAARGIIRGYQDGRFGPQDTTLRAQMAALIARAMGWDGEDHANRFPDRGSVDADLWRNVGTLAFYNVARGYQDGSYKPTNPVLYAQTISFITRAMVAQGYWQQQSDDPALYPNVPASSGHRADLATYVTHAGAVPGTSQTVGWGNWDRPSSRSWFAQALWQALDSHFGQDRVP
jgi:uncharacterized repeat protein (TIGR02543 family)